MADGDGYARRRWGCCSHSSAALHWLTSEIRLRTMCSFCHLAHAATVCVVGRWRAISCTTSILARRPCCRSKGSIWMALRCDSLSERVPDALLFCSRGLIVLAGTMKAYGHDHVIARQWGAVPALTGLQLLRLRAQARRHNTDRLDASDRHRLQAQSGLPSPALRQLSTQHQGACTNGLCPGLGLQRVLTLDVA